ncbi:probable S-adenosylmethionine-dependent methyltransferase At5g37990 [Coffea eugenioides]|uniref:probable S-adenosylmethionine-dependent methyltransferase At5g37990 n=1 Tax=Coffea eugenioides TaxID=49369 RepID=UPI000F609331|nr:probable S-adenosylmethionine-dependent methyltransferase At5g37990 [Coffea eugenioides]
MEGGDGPYSYTQNSEYQKQSLDSAKQLTNELIDQHLVVGNHPCSFSNSYRVADFGCSVGPNTFCAVHNIIEAVENKYKSQKMESRTPEFHVFFNDHVGNDFNTLFRNIPATGRYFAAGVPGSFHGRLLPSSTLHFAHCSTALHWLSKIPKEVTDKNSPAWNKGRIHYAGAAKEVKDAYSTQFAKDFDSFLSARAQELVPGGLMVLVSLGFPDGVQVCESSMGENFNILGSCFLDIAKTGIITQEMVDSFNLPFYYPWPSELKSLIDVNGLFEIKKIEKLVAPTRQVKPDLAVCVLHLRAILGELIKKHFGEGITDILFKRHTKKYVESPIVSDGRYFKETSYFVFLKRKMNCAS